jgi:competence protein ComGC
MNPLIKLVIILVLLAHCLVTYSVETETCTNPDCAGVRVITEEELKTYEIQTNSNVQSQKLVAVLKKSCISLPN